MKIIICQMKPDWVKPYVQDGTPIPVVILSTHPRFVEGTRLDYGFVQVALRDGYHLQILPQEKP